jgi:nucleoside-diphosphate-sugar epimerase
LEELRKSGLEWTVFHNGIFLGYFGTPDMKPHLKPIVFAIDTENKVAGIPGDGSAPVTFTYTFDLAKFVVAALDLERWEEGSCVVGNELTFNEFVVLAQEARGIHPTHQICFLMRPC